MYKGIFLSVVASIFFGIQYYYATLIDSLDSEEIFLWRIFICFIFITFFIIFTQEKNEVILIIKRIKGKPLILIGMILSSLILAYQQWLFIWAPLNGKALNVSLGYFLLPIAMLLVGKFLYKEEITYLQTLAVFSALYGIFHEIYIIGTLPIEALAVAFGFSIYFIIRKKLDINNLAGLWFDLLIFMPFLIYFAYKKKMLATYLHLDNILLFKIILFGLISAIAFMTYIASSRRLPFIIFGLLGYLEPVLLALASFAIGDKLSEGKLLTYVPIWFAVFFLIIDGVVALFRINKLKI